jgi:hypothetical protein
VDSPPYRVNRNADGSLGVWVGEVGIHFPVDGKPTVTKGQAPEGATPSDPAVTVLGGGEEGTTVSCHGRVVLIKPDGSTEVVSDKPRGGPSRTFRVRRARG